MADESPAGHAAGITLFFERTAMSLAEVGKPWPTAAARREVFRRTRGLRMYGRRFAAETFISVGNVTKNRYIFENYELFQTADGLTIILVVQLVAGAWRAVKWVATRSDKLWRNGLEMRMIW